MFHKRLRLARKRKGLSMQALADKVTPKITAQAISKYETGRMMPSSAVLVGLADALQVSLDFLMSAQVEALDGLEFRKHSATSARDRALAEAIVIDNLERYLAVEDILGIPPQIDGFDELATDHIASEDEIDAKADQLRDFWQLGIDPIPSMCALLEDHGIKVVEDDLPQRINGLACRVLRSGKPVADAVVVSTQTNVERKRFNLAHELAHRIIGATQNPEIRLEPAMNRSQAPSSSRASIYCSKRGPTAVASPTTRSFASSTPTAFRRQPCSCASDRSASCAQPMFDTPSRPLRAPGAPTSPTRSVAAMVSEHSRNPAVSNALFGMRSAKNSFRRCAPLRSSTSPVHHRTPPQWSPVGVNLIIVNDASCLIGLRKGGLFPFLGSLPYHLVVPLPVRRSEVLDFTGDDWHLLDSDGLLTYDLDANEVRAAFAVKERHPALSANDYFCYVTAHIHSGILLTGDALLRRVATENGLRVQGVLWVIDQLLDVQSSQRLILVQALETWLSDDTVFLPNDAVSTRLRWLASLP